MVDQLELVARSTARSPRAHAGCGSDPSARASPPGSCLPTARRATPAAAVPPVRAKISTRRRFAYDRLDTTCSRRGTSRLPDRLDDVARPHHGARFFAPYGGRCASTDASVLPFNLGMLADQHDFQDAQVVEQAQILEECARRRSAAILCGGRRLRSVPRYMMVPLSGRTRPSAC